MGEGRVLERPYEYAGEPVVTALAWPSTIGSHLTRGERVAVLREWLSFFAQPTSIRELTLACRVNDSLLRALVAQTQLEKLTLRWGPYTDLTAIAQMPGLTSLTLGGASAATDLRPLTALTRLTELSIENGRKLTDYSPLGKIHSLTELQVVRSISGGRTDADSLAFVGELSSLCRLVWDPRVTDRDYTPLLALTEADEIIVTATTGMTPSLADLEWALPGMQAANRRRSERRVPIFGPDGSVAVMTQDVTGATVIVAPAEGEVFETEPDDSHATPELVGPVAGVTIRTLSGTARTRTERYRVRIQSPPLSEEIGVPPSERVLGEYSFSGLAEGPLLIWDSPAPVQGKGDLADFFDGNRDVQNGPRLGSRTMDASDMPILHDEEFWPYLDDLAEKGGVIGCIRVAKRLAEQDESFILCWTQTFSQHAIALVPLAEQLVSDGIIAGRDVERVIAAAFARGKAAYLDLFNNPAQLASKTKAGQSEIFAVPADALARRNSEIGEVITPLTAWLDQRTDPNLADWAAGASGIDLWSARAFVQIDQEIRERVILINLHDAPDAEWPSTVEAAFRTLGGDVVAGPEIGKNPPRALDRTDVAFITRRHSALPLNDYAARYASHFHGR